ncbi:MULTISPECIES: peptide chain release factor N(5)-glutamine methyltransferase [unclassified Cyanobium]|uniref:peptide chain release factor N(5)-glutamine methyltransferase n=1 Tax=unclassified Cyanobium TaxID=2627006 RepID=UPI0020CFA1A0|nr:MULTISPECIES: peptide chain release factor N(5)-glutamine methyltransferase [unclassified Cyanobium]MCP9835083.1 peptide chain release factor N(5)-glutamine methyltransferase [Cyanobium sp. La Preciosa 7G6]MCP9937846.1 peptide chain release factor N(5)-glutamine methyltransferase [Cyanobium sp. Aljojuca 7A6]
MVFQVGTVPVSAPPADGPDGLMITASELLGWRRRLLALGGEATALDWLLDLGAGLRWSQLQALWCHPQAEVRLHRSLEGLEALWRRHLHTHEPLQYLVGRCPWRDLELPVAPGVLIPRQETELLVDLALSLGPAARPPSRWADLGTGSGCLAIALARSLPESRGFAAEASPEALVQAIANLTRWDLQQRVTPLAGDWWQPLAPWWGALDLVVSNPPYIPSATLLELDPVVRNHEPRLALDGGPDGLAAIRSIVAGSPRGLAPGGLLLLEHHHDQSEAVGELLRAAGLERLGVHADLEGRARFASGWRPCVR